MSTISGFGFKVPENEKKFIAFLKAHKKAFCAEKNTAELDRQIYDDIMHMWENEQPVCMSDIEYLLDDHEYQCGISGHAGIGAVVSNIMREETGIEFEYQSGDAILCSPNAVLFTPRYPWFMNPVEKALTHEKLLEICAKYIKELGGDESPTYLNVSYL